MPIDTIKIEGLEAVTSVVEELIDFLLSLVANEEVLEHLEFSDFSGLDKPFDKFALQRANNIVQSFKLGSMEKLQEDVKFSMTYCVSEFFSESSILEQIDCREYVTNQDEAMMLLDNARSVETLQSLPKIESKFL